MTYWNEEEFYELQNLLRDGQPDNHRFIELRGKYSYLERNLVKAIGYGCCSAIAKVNNRGCTFGTDVKCTEKGEWRIKVLPDKIENTDRAVLDFIRKYFPMLDCRVEKKRQVEGKKEKKNFLFVYLRNKYKEDVIKGFNKWTASKGEIDSDTAVEIGYAVCEAVNMATNESCICDTEIGEQMGEYGPQWVLDFIHGHLKNKNLLKVKKGADPSYYMRGGLIAGKAEIPLIVTKFMDTIYESVNFTVEEDEDDGTKFSMYINKKMFPVVLVEVGGRIQKVRLVDPEYCGIDLDTQKKHAQYMISDIERLQKKIYEDLKRNKE
jgi:hypothetical protein